MKRKGKGKLRENEKRIEKKKGGKEREKLEGFYKGCSVHYRKNSVFCR